MSHGPAQHDRATESDFTRRRRPPRGYRRVCPTDVRSPTDAGAVRDTEQSLWRWPSWWPRSPAGWSVLADWSLGYAEPGLPPRWPPPAARTATATATRDVGRPGRARRVPHPVPPEDDHHAADHHQRCHGRRAAAGRDAGPWRPAAHHGGQEEFAWDTKQSVRPGDLHGHVLLNAHVWPDGSAVGNRMLAKLAHRRPDRGEGHQPEALLPGGQAGPGARVGRPAGLLHETGPPRLAFVTCSGKRLGPGVWTKRTVWYAAPMRLTASGSLSRGAAPRSSPRPRAAARRWRRSPCAAARIASIRRSVDSGVLARATR